MSLNFGLKNKPMAFFFQSKEEDTGANHSLKTLSSRRGFCLLGHLEFWIVWVVIRMHMSPSLPSQLPYL